MNTSFPRISAPRGLLPPYAGLVLTVVLTVVLTGCYGGLQAEPNARETDDRGEETDDGGPSSDEGSGDDSTDPEQAPTIGASHLRRLTDWEYINTVRDLFGAEVLDDISLVLAALPTSRAEDGYSTMDRSITAAHIDADYRAALAIAQRVSESGDTRAQLSPCLAAPDQDCIETFTRTFGQRVYRRPVTEQEQERMFAAYWTEEATTVDAQVESLLLYMLMTPQFLYRPEIDGVPSESETTYRLSDYELASRLSYLVWGSMPDEALFAAAAAGQLDEDGLVREAERLLDTPRARTGVRRFYREWLEVEDRPGLAFSDRFMDGLPTDGLRDDIMAEPIHLGEWLTLDEEGSLSELWTTRAGFVTSPGLATIYGVKPGGSEPVTLPSGRGGLLTRAALLIASGEETPPIVRGAFISNRLLCNALALPDPCAFPTDQFEPPPFDPDKTNRQRWEEKTSPPQCNACHQHINPYGFAAEGYDAIGRTRTHEEIIDPEGEIVNSLPVDTRTSAVIDGKTVDVADLVALGAALAGSDAATRCFAVQWFRYAFGRYPTPDDATTINALAAKTPEISLRELLIELIASPQFRYVTVEAQP